MSTVDQEAPLEWPPYIITEVECFNEPRTGFIGRAMAVRQLGLEFIVVAKNAEQLNLVTQNFLGIETDEARVYKATVIQSAGVAIQPMPETQADAPGLAEQQATAGSAVPDSAGLLDPVTTTALDDDDDEL